MSKFEKLIMRLLSGAADKNFSFDDLVRLLENLGFTHRMKGSHHVFFKEGVTEIINVQSKEGKAKPYQVRQVRELIIKYKLWNNDAGA